MRVPADFDRYKSDGRVIDIDVNDPSINQVGEPQDTPTAQRFADWLRSNGVDSAPRRDADRGPDCEPG